MDISIIIPAYNEEKRIGSTLSAYSEYFEKLREKDKIDYEIIIVINATTDNTLDVVKSFIKKNKRIKYLNLKKGGKGYAVREGFKASSGELQGFTDADMATRPEDFYDLCKNIGNADGIIASRWIPGSIIKTQQKPIRKLASYVFNFLVRAMFFMPYRDTQCGAKVLRKETSLAIMPKMTITQWAFDVNLLYLCKLNNFKIKEHPTVWEDKEGSKINIFSSSLKMFLGIVRLRILYSPFKKLISLYDSLPLRIKAKHGVN